MNQGHREYRFPRSHWSEAFLLIRVNKVLEWVEELRMKPVSYEGIVQMQGRIVSLAACLRV